MMQEIIAILLVLAAVLFLGYRASRRFAARNRGECSGCCGKCAPQKDSSSAS